MTGNADALESAATLMGGAFFQTLPRAVMMPGETLQGQVTGMTNVGDAQEDSMTMLCETG